MPEHRDLTGAALHESKGVDSASVNTVYVANGAGSGAWSKLPAAAVDTATILNINKQYVTMTYPDIGTAGSRYLAILRTLKINKITAVPQSVPATTATVLTIRNDAGTSMGTITIPIGAVAGSQYSLSPASNNTFVANTKLQVETDGGTPTANVEALLTIELEWT